MNDFPDGPGIASSEGRLNILFITSDQQRWDAIGYANPLVKTPHIDGLAARGIHFDRAYTPSPVCTPSRCSMLTGHYPSRHGCYTIGTSLPEDYPTVATELGNHGYFTSLIGKAHFQSCLAPGSFEAAPRIFDREFYRHWSGPYFGFEHTQLVIGHTCERHPTGMHYGLWLEEHGVDLAKHFGHLPYEAHGVWDLPEEFHPSKWTADRTIDAIERSRQQERPFFIWSSFQDPHNPFVVPEPWASMYERSKMPVYGTRPGEFDEKPPFYRNVAEGDGYGMAEHFGEKNWHCVRNLPLSEDDRREVAALYYGMVSLMDHHIGRILRHLDEQQLLDKTLIVFTSDHGEYLGNHGMWWKGLPAYDDALRVPFVVAHPACRTPGSASDAFQSHVDLVPSFLATAGVPLPPLLQGVDQTPAWTYPDVTARDWAMVEFRPTESAFMQKVFLHGRHKLVVYHTLEFGELYDMQSDPDQLVNLWGKPEAQAIREELLRRLVAAEMEKDGSLRPRLAPA